MKTIILAGALGEQFGREWSLDVRTPAEALRAIDANRPGFFHSLIESGDKGITYRVLLDEREVDVDELSYPFGRETFRIIPVVAGASRGVWKTVAGVLITVAAIYFSGGTLAGTSAIGVSYGSIAMFGVAMTVSGISQMLAGNPSQIMDTNKADQKPSYFFNGPVNVATQGGPVPIGIGRLIVGSTVINGGIRVDEVPL
jgi:predicted phage tail protein